MGGLLILLPGFITLFVERSLAYQREPSGTVVVARALVYSLINYAIFALTKTPLLVWQVTAIADRERSVAVLPSAFSALLLVLIAVATGLVIGAFKTHDWHMAAARKMSLTRRTSRESIWLDVFQAYYGERDYTGPYVVVVLNDGRRIDGWPMYFSDEYHEGPALFLTQARWLQEDGDLVRIPDPGIMLNGSQIEFVQFYSPSTEGGGE